MTEGLLSVEDLTISFLSEAGPLRVVDGISFAIGREVVALVGESGSGKSMTGRAIMGLLPRQADIRARRLEFDGQDLTALSPSGWNRLRGAGIGLILQDPKYSLNPAHRIGRQVEEALLLHARLSAGERRDRALDMLDKVGLPDPKRSIRVIPQRFPAAWGSVR